MKRLIIIISSLATVLVLCSATPKNTKTVVYASDVECKNCEKKVMENVAFEKGVKNLSVDLAKHTVTVVFDETKTDTLALAKAIRKLGFEAKVSSYK